MTLPLIFFYLFSGVTIASAVMVIAAKNPVHAVLFLILCFVNAAGLFLLAGAEFLAMLLVIVYVGAVAVLFLFVVMMLDINFVQMRQGFLTYLPVGGLIGLVLLIELALVLAGWAALPIAKSEAVMPMPPVNEVTNTHALGAVLYTHYVYLFQVSGLILLVAMIGAIVLTLRHRTDVKRQSVGHQISRVREEAVEIKKVKPWQGAS